MGAVECAYLVDLLGGVGERGGVKGRCTWSQVAWFTFARVVRVLGWASWEGEMNLVDIMWVWWFVCCVGFDGAIWIDVF